MVNSAYTPWLISHHGVFGGKLFVVIESQFEDTGSLVHHVALAKVAKFFEGEGGRWVVIKVLGLLNVCA